MSPGPIAFGGFEAHARIGRGGMGEVWRGVHLRTGTPVALKLITSERATDPRFVEAFHHEAAAVAALAHPCVVEVHDVGRVDAAASRASGGRFVEGSPYLVMELAEGTLEPWCGSAPWEDTRRVLLDVLAALAHAHAAGVVHRDIKPSNILLDRLGQPRLSDFGIARSSGSGALSAGGTPAYRAPEQLDRVHEQGPWTDLYAVGALTWALVTGAPLGGAAGLTGPGLPPLRAAVAVPEGLERWLRRCLAGDPASRFRHAVDAAAALRTLGEATVQASVPARGAPSTTQTAAWGEVGGEHPIAATLPWLGEVDPSSTPSPSWPPGDAAGPAPIDVPDPPAPGDWRAHRPARVRPLTGVGLGLFGLRRVPLFGRHEERDLLWSALGEVARRRQARAVVVRGASGVGKSRLVEWLTVTAGERGVAGSLRAVHQPGGTPWDGVVGALKRRHDAPDRSRAALERSLARALGDEADDARWLAELLRPATEADPAAGDVPEVRTIPVRVQVVVRQLRRMCARRPLILWLDDAQWSEDAFALTETLLEQQLPVLVVLTLQEEAVADGAIPAGRLRGLLERAQVTEIPLGPLDDAAHLEMLRTFLGFDADLAARLHAGTRGNPQLAVQLVRDWVDGGRLELGPHGFRLRDGASVELPEDLRAMWDARVRTVFSGLEPPDVLAVELAATLGREVDAREWEEVCAEAGVRLSEAGLDTLLRGALVRPTGSRGEGPGFPHVMIRAAVVRHAKAAGRWVDHNRRCARVLERLSRPDTDARLGRHLLEAGMLRRAVPHLLGGVLDHFDRTDYGRALVLLDETERAMRAGDLPESDPLWGELGLGRSQAWRYLPDLERAMAEARRAAEAAERHGWQHIAASALLKQAIVMRFSGEPERALELGERAAAAAGAMTEEPARRGLPSQAYNLWSTSRIDLAIALRALGRYERSEALLRRVIREIEARSFSGSCRANAYNMLATTLYEQGRLDEAARGYQQAIELATPERIVFVLDRAEMGLAGIAEARGDWRAAAAGYARAVRSARDRDWIEGLCFYATHHALSCMLAGDDALAIESLREVSVAWTGPRTGVWLSAHVGIACHAARRGAGGEAERVLRSALEFELTRAMGYPKTKVLLLLDELAERAAAAGDDGLVALVDEARAGLPER